MEIVPDDRKVYQISTQVNFADERLSSLEWSILNILDGHKNILEVARALGIEIKKVMFAFFLLVDSRLIEEVEAEFAEYIEVEHIENLEMQLTKILGPVATIIIDDVLIEMNLTRSTIKQDEIYSFVEAVSNEITDEDKKLEFQEIMLFILKKVMS